MQKEELARLAVELLSQARIATLATNSQVCVGYPFASMVELAVDNSGLPLLLLSGLAMHSKNLRDDPRASLLVTATSESNSVSLARATFVGECQPADDSSQKKLKEQFLAANPQSKQWAGFGDFQIFELRLESIYVIAGFGGMGWIQPKGYQEQFFAKGSA